MPQIIYTMKGLSKTHPPAKQVLKDIYLSFFEGAKIGVLGLNGAGKSSLLRIMAGVDKEYQGEAFIGQGKTVGYLEQEPKLDPNKTVKENVMEGVAETAKLLKDFEDIAAKFAEEILRETNFIASLNRPRPRLVRQDSLGQHGNCLCRLFQRRGHQRVAHELRRHLPLANSVAVVEVQLVGKTQ